MKFRSLNIATANLAFRFVLELCAFVSIGYWAYHQAEGLLGGTLALVIPLILALIWGAFGVPEDPSRAGRPAVHIPGVLRLILEMLFFGFALFCLFSMSLPLYAWLLLAALVVNYALAYRRLLWLVKQVPPRKSPRSSG